MKTFHKLRSEGRGDEMKKKECPVICEYCLLLFHPANKVVSPQIFLLKKKTCPEPWLTNMALVSVPC